MAAIGIALIAGVLALFAAPFADAILVAVLLGGLAAVAWSLVVARPRARLGAVEALPQTHGILMDWAAPFYEGLCRLVGLGPAFRARMLDILALRRGEQVLDAGCGTGVMTRMAAAAVGPSGRAVGSIPAPG